MPRTRSHSNPSQKALQNTQTHPTPLNELNELNHDIDINTGYLVKNPVTQYGKRVKELVNYTCSQSSEFKTITNSRRLRPSPLCTYLLQVFRFLADYVIPVTVALAVSAYYYTSLEPLAPPAVVEKEETPSEHEDTWVDSAAVAGDWTGETIRYALSIPLSFVTSTIDGGFHISRGLHSLRQSAESIVYTPLLFVGVYCATLVLIRFLLNLYTLFSAERTLWNYQELILQETAQVVERAVTSLLRPELLRAGDNNPLLLETLVTRIKAKPLPELLVLGHVSTQYTNGLHMLIRHADEELSTAMFRLTNELHKIEGGLTRTGGYRE
jgi:hypothetical protein